MKRSLYSAREGDGEAAASASAPSIGGTAQVASSETAPLPLLAADVAPATPEKIVPAEGTMFAFGAGTPHGSSSSLCGGSAGPQQRTGGRAWKVGSQYSSPHHLDGQTVLHAHLNGTASGTGSATDRVLCGTAARHGRGCGGSAAGGGAPAPGGSGAGAPLGDLWDRFVRDNWAPALEQSFGPGWREQYPEEVTAILWWALSSRSKVHAALPALGPEAAPDRPAAAPAAAAAGPGHSAPVLPPQHPQQSDEEGDPAGGTAAGHTSCAATTSSQAASTTAGPGAVVSLRPVLQAYKRVQTTGSDGQPVSYDILVNVGSVSSPASAGSASTPVSHPCSSRPPGIPTQQQSCVPGDAGVAGSSGGPHLSWRAEQAAPAPEPLARPPHAAAVEAAKSGQGGVSGAGVTVDLAVPTPCVAAAPTTALGHPAQLPAAATVMLTPSSLASALRLLSRTVPALASAAAGAASAATGRPGAGGMTGTDAFELMRLLQSELEARLALHDQVGLEKPLGCVLPHRIAFSSCPTSQVGGKLASSSAAPSLCGGPSSDARHMEGEVSAAGAGWALLQPLKPGVLVPGSIHQPLLPFRRRRRRASDAPGVSGMETVPRQQPALVGQTPLLPEVQRYQQQYQLLQLVQQAAPGLFGEDTLGLKLDVLQAGERTSLQSTALQVAQELLHSLKALNTSPVGSELTASPSPPPQRRQAGVAATAGVGGTAAPGPAPLLSQAGASPAACAPMRPTNPILDLSSHPAPSNKTSPAAPPLAPAASSGRADEAAGHVTPATGSGSGSDSAVSSRWDSDSVLLAPGIAGGAAGIPLDAAVGGPLPLYLLDSLVSGATFHSIVDGADAAGRAPLHVAAAAGRVDIVEQLVYVGADTNKRLAVDFLASADTSCWTTPMGGSSDDEEEVSSTPPTDPAAAGPATQAAARRRVLAPISAMSGPALVSIGGGEAAAAAAATQSAAQRTARLAATGVPPCFLEQPSFVGATPLHLAAYFGHAGVVELLLRSSGCDVSAQTEDGLTALHLAANQGHAAVTARLVKQPGCELDAVDEDGYTPLHHAAALGHGAVVEELWPRGANIETAATPCGRTALHLAAEAGHTLVVGRLVIAGGHVSRADGRGCAPGHLAALRGHPDVLRKLLLAGYDVDTPCLLPEDALPNVPEPMADGDDTDLANDGSGHGGHGGHQGGTALHLAAWAGHVEAVRVLLAAGACIGREDARRQPPLHRAAEGGHLPVLEVLLQHGANAFRLSRRGNSALHSAALGGSLPVLNRLVSLGADPNACNSAGRVPLHVAAAVGTVPMCARLLELAGGSAPMAGGPSQKPCLGAAAASNASDSNSGGDDSDEEDDDDDDDAADDDDVDNDNADEGGSSGMAGSIGTVEDLASAGTAEAVVSGGGTSAAACGPAQPAASCRPDVSTMPRIFAREHGAKAPTEVQQLPAAARSIPVEAILKADVDGHTPWHLAADKDQVEVIELFLQYGTPVDSLDDSGATALHRAARAGALDAVELLLARGASLQAACLEGQTALLHAAEGRHAAVVNMLLERLGPADVSRRDACGWSAVHHAAEQGNMEMLQALLKAGAAVGAVSGQGWTPLHLAAKEQHHAAVQVLLESGCPAAAADRDGCTALHYAALHADEALFSHIASQAPELLHRRKPAHGQVEGPSTAGGPVEHTVPEPHPMAAPVPGQPHAVSLLHYAVQGGNARIVQVLLNAGLAELDDRAGVTGAINALHIACKLACPTTARALLALGYAADTRAPGGQRPLLLACMAAVGGGSPEAVVASTAAESTAATPDDAAQQRWQDQCEVADLLLAAGADPLAVDDQGCTTVMYAAGSGNMSLLHRLLALGVNPSLCDANGWGALTWAAAAEHADAVAALALVGVPLAAADRAGRTALHWAADKGAVGAVAVLVDALGPAGLDVHAPDASGQSAAQLAAGKGYVEVVARLLEGSAAATAGGSKGGTALHLAAQSGLDQVVAQLLGVAGCDVNARDADGLTPLHCAAARGSLPIMARLLQYGADVSAATLEGSTAMHRAAASGSLEVVEALLTAGGAAAARTSNGSTPLHHAASGGHAAVCERLLQAGCPINGKTVAGCTALYCAASNGHVEVVEVLLAADGGAVDALTTSGCTALHIAASNGHAAVVQKLYEEGADPDVQSANGHTPLHNAVSGGHQAAADVLMAAGCDWDVQNANGNTALHIAASKGHMEILNKLLAGGCDVHIRNCKAWQAVHSAASAGALDIVLRLVAAGAAWRTKAGSGANDVDVVKMLCRKSSLKPSYVEGRLRLAEREKHRGSRQTRPAATAAGQGPAGGTLAPGGQDNSTSSPAIGSTGPTSGGDHHFMAVAPEAVAAEPMVDLQDLAAAADANMAALLAEEQAAAQAAAEAAALAAERRKAKKLRSKGKAKSALSTMVAASKPASDAENGGSSADAGGEVTDAAADPDEAGNPAAASEEARHRDGDKLAPSYQMLTRALPKAQGTSTAAGGAACANSDSVTLGPAIVAAAAATAASVAGGRPKGSAKDEKLNNAAQHSCAMASKTISKASAAQAGKETCVSTPFDRDAPEARDAPGARKQQQQQQQSSNVTRAAVTAASTAVAAAAATSAATAAATFAAAGKSKASTLAALTAAAATGCQSDCQLPADSSSNISEATLPVATLQPTAVSLSTASSSAMPAPGGKATKAAHPALGQRNTAPAAAQAGLASSAAQPPSAEAAQQQQQPGGGAMSRPSVAKAAAGTEAMSPPLPLAARVRAPPAAAVPKSTPALASLGGAATAATAAASLSARRDRAANGGGGSPQKEGASHRRGGGAPASAVARSASAMATATAAAGAARPVNATPQPPASYKQAALAGSLAASGQSGPPAAAPGLPASPLPDALASDSTTRPVPTAQPQPHAPRSSEARDTAMGSERQAGASLCGEPAASPTGPAPPAAVTPARLSLSPGTVQAGGLASPGPSSCPTGRPAGAYLGLDSSALASQQLAAHPSSLDGHQAHQPQAQPASLLAQPVRGPLRPSLPINLFDDDTPSPLAQSPACAAVAAIGYTGAARASMGPPRPGIPPAPQAHFTMSSSQGAASPSRVFSPVRLVASQPQSPARQGPVSPRLDMAGAHPMQHQQRFVSQRQPQHGGTTPDSPLLSPPVMQPVTTHLWQDEEDLLVGQYSQEELYSGSQPVVDWSFSGSSLPNLHSRPLPTGSISSGVSSMFLLGSSAPQPTTPAALMALYHAAAAGGSSRPSAPAHEAASHSLSSTPPGLPQHIWGSAPTKQALPPLPTLCSSLPAPAMQQLAGVAQPQLTPFPQGAPVPPTPEGAVAAGWQRPGVALPSSFCVPGAGDLFTSLGSIWSFSPSVPAAAPALCSVVNGPAGGGHNGLGSGGGGMSGLLGSTSNLYGSMDCSHGGGGNVDVGGQSAAGSTGSLAELVGNSGGCNGSITALHAASGGSGDGSSCGGDIMPETGGIGAGDDVTTAGQFICPLTQRPMRDPVVAADDYTYERSAITDWLRTHTMSPVTQQPLRSREVVPNLTMKAAMQLLGHS